MAAAAAAGAGATPFEVDAKAAAVAPLITADTPLQPFVDPVTGRIPVAATFSVRTRRAAAQFLYESLAVPTIPPALVMAELALPPDATGIHDVHGHMRSKVAHDIPGNKLFVAVCDGPGWVPGSAATKPGAVKAQRTLPFDAGVCVLLALIHGAGLQLDVVYDHQPPLHRAVTVLPCLAAPMLALPPCYGLDVNVPRRGTPGGTARAPPWSMRADLIDALVCRSSDAVLSAYGPGPDDGDAKGTMFHVAVHGICKALLGIRETRLRKAPVPVDSCAPQRDVLYRLLRHAGAVGGTNGLDPFCVPVSGNNPRPPLQVLLTRCSLPKYELFLQPLVAAFEETRTAFATFRPRLVHHMRDAAGDSICVDALLHIVVAYVCGDVKSVAANPGPAAPAAAPAAPALPIAPLFGSRPDPALPSLLR